MSLPLEVPDDVKSGSVLFGDDFAPNQLAEWVAQEQESFYHDDQGNSDVDPWYAYMRYVNDRLGFSTIRAEASQRRSMLVLGPGSGIEVQRFADQSTQWSMHFVEASANFRNELRRKWPSSVAIEPDWSGKIELPRDSQDVVCAFSVLHHVANVSTVINEVFKVTRPGGVLLVREPCSSMGDWRFARSATPNERGISRDLLVVMARTAGFSVEVSPIPILFEPINKLLKRSIGYAAVPFGVLYIVDRVASRIAAWNDHYWRDAWYKKIGPSSYFYVFRKPR